MSQPCEQQRYKPNSTKQQFHPAHFNIFYYMYLLTPYGGGEGERRTLHTTFYYDTGQYKLVWWVKILEFE